MTTYLHLTPTNAKHESRLLKEASVALDSGLFQAVEVLAKKGRGDEGLPLREEPIAGVRLERIPVRLRFGKAIAHCLWLAQALARGAMMRPSVVSVHHVMLLPLGVAIKVATGARLIYDAHELETESASLVGRPRKKAILKILERVFIRFCDHTIVVGTGIADWYRAAYAGVRVTAIHNYPRRRSAALGGRDDRLRRILNIPPDKTVFIYQGVLEEDRGIPLLLETFSAGLVPDGVFVAMGYGTLEPAIRQTAEASPYVRFQPAVPPEQILAWTSGADFGLTLLPAVCLSYRLSLPNKFFEYLQAGLPVIVANDLVEMKNLVREFDLGEITALDVASVAATLGSMSVDSRRRLATNIEAAADRFVWEAEALRLEALYRDVCSDRRTRTESRSGRNSFRSAEGADGA